MHPTNQFSTFYRVFNSKTTVEEVKNNLGKLQSALDDDWDSNDPALQPVWDCYIYGLNKLAILSKQQTQQ